MSTLVALAILAVGFWYFFTSDLSFTWKLIGAVVLVTMATPSGGILGWLRRHMPRGRRVALEEDPRTLSGAEFEAWVAASLEREGFDHVRVTGGAGDMGADVLAQRGEILVAIQAKQIGRALGTEAVQDAISGREAHDAQEGWVVTTAQSVTQAARKFARRTEIEIRQV